MNELTHKDLPVVSFVTQDEFYAWLGAHNESQQPFWLRYYKKATNKPTIVHGDAVDVALCWGWIDGLTNRYDDESYLIRFTPRRKKSVWSKINVEKVALLTKQKRMQPSGLAHVKSAQADGRWNAAYAGQATMQVPKEFIDLLKTDSATYDFYTKLNKANIYAIAFRIATAVGSDNQQKVMQKLFTMLQERKTFH